MIDIKTRVYKSIRDGWVAESTTPLLFQIEGKPTQLRLSTSKRQGGVLETYASVQSFDDGFVTFRVFRDFSQRIIKDTMRCTEKSVRLQHDLALTMIEDVTSAALSHHKALGDCVPCSTT